MTMPAKLSLKISVLPANLSGLVIQGGSFDLEKLSLVGDTVSAHSTVEAVTAQLPTSSDTQEFMSLPPGLYSRIRCELDDLRISGSWGGHSLRINIGVEGATVDVRTDTIDLQAGQSVQLGLKIDTNQWFTSSILNSAHYNPFDDDPILIDDYHNADVGLAIASRLAGSVSVDSMPPQ